MKKKAKKKKTAKAKPKAKAKKKTLRAKARPKKAPKKTKKKAAKAKPKAKKKARAKKAKSGKPELTFIPPANGVLVGRVEDFFAHINVIAFNVQKPIRVGDQLHVMGHTTNIQQTLDSMQINHQPVEVAQPNDAVGIKITGRARRGDHVYLIPA